MGNQPTREHLITVGLELMRSSGYTATGINQILAAAQVPKGSFYHYFATKDEFVVAVIGRYAAGEHERAERLLGDMSVPPLVRLRRYFEDLIAVYGQKGGPMLSGCLLGNLSLEIAGQNEAIRDRLNRAFRGWQSALASTIRQAMEQRELPKTARPDDLAALLVNGWEGAQVRAKTEQSDGPLLLFFEYAFDVLLAG